MKGYIIERAILVTIQTYDAFIADVYTIPFTGTDKRKAQSFYLDIQRFLSHLICNNFLYAEATADDDPYTKYSPISSQLGKEVLPFVFEQEKNLCCQRALELLEKAKIIKIKRHNFNKHKSRQFALSKASLKRWFGDKQRQQYMMQSDRYRKLTASFRRKELETLSKEEIINKILEGQKKPKHATRHISRDTAQYMQTVYARMGVLRINLDKLFDYTPQNAVENLHKTQILQHLMERGCRLVSSSPLLVEYLPEYKLAVRGTRSFEKNGGFQALKSSIKWAIFEGYNYDIKSSQLNILKHEFIKYGIRCKRLRRISKERVMERFGVSDKVAKLLIYSLIFSLGQVNSSKTSKVFQRLLDSHDYETLLTKLARWRKFVKPIKRSLQQLVDYYIEQGNYRSDRGLSIRNALNHTYLIQGKKVTNQQRRKILSHMIQGIESHAIYETILNNPNVCGSIEHDGLVSSKPIKWEHPYLRLVLKY